MFFSALGIYYNFIISIIIIIIIFIFYLFVLANQHEACRH